MYFKIEIKIQKYNYEVIYNIFFNKKKILKSISLSKLQLEKLLIKN